MYHPHAIHPHGSALTNPRQRGFIVLIEVLAAVAVLATVIAVVASISHLKQQRNQAFAQAQEYQQAMNIIALLQAGKEVPDDHQLSWQIEPSPDGLRVLRVELSNGKQFSALLPAGDF